MNNNNLPSAGDLYRQPIPLPLSIEQEQLIMLKRIEALLEQIATNTSVKPAPRDDRKVRSR